MRPTKHPILRIACLASIALCVLLGLQSAGFVRPIGVGFGDGARGRAYSFGFDGTIRFETLAGMRPIPPSSPIGVEGRPTDFAGFRFFRWNMVTLGDNRKPLPGVYATKIEFTIAMVWPV